MATSLAEIFDKRKTEGEPAIGQVANDDCETSEESASTRAANDDCDTLAGSATAGSPLQQRIDGNVDSTGNDRQWRQTLERQVAELHTRLEAPKPPAPPPKPQDDADWYANPTDWTRAEIDKRAQEAEQRFVAVGVRMAQAQFADYPDAVTALIEAAKTDPYIEQRIATVPPESRAFAAYKLGKDYLQRSKYGDSIEEIRRKIREEERAALEKENKSRQAEAAVAQVVPSTACARGSGSTTKQRFEPTPLDEIFAGRKF